MVAMPEEIMKPGSTPRRSRPSSSRPVLALLATLLGLAAYHHYGRVQPRRPAPEMRGGMLMSLHGRAPNVLPLSKHSCTPAEDPNHRVCKFSNLLLVDGIVYYLTDDASEEVPVVDVKYHSKDDEKFAPKVLLRQDAAQIIDKQGLQWASMPRVWLWHVTKQWVSLAHHFGEDVITLHNTLCEVLGECSFPPKQELQLLLLNTNWWKPLSGLLQAVNQTQQQCMTGWPAVYREDSRLADKAVLLKTAWAGIGPRCRAQKGCARASEFGANRGDKRMPLKPASLRLWRERLGACYGMDVTTPAPVHPKTVLVIDRPYEAGRHILNIRSVEALVRQRFPRDDVRLVYMEDLSFVEQLRTMSTASIVVMMHGSAMALWMMLPPNAVAIHIAPDLESLNVMQFGWAAHYARDFAFNGLTYVPINNTEASRQHMRWEKLVPLKEYKMLSAEEKLELLEHATCPERLDKACTFHWKRQELSLVLDLDHLAWALDKAEHDLLQKSRRS